MFTKEIKITQSTLLGFLSTREKCRQARAEGKCFSDFSLIVYITQQYTRNKLFVSYIKQQRPQREKVLHDDIMNWV